MTLIAIVVNDGGITNHNEALAAVNSKEHTRTSNVVMVKRLISFSS